MKRELALAGIALVVSILLSSPSIAQTTPAKSEPAPVAATHEAPALEEMSLDDAILFASTADERKRLLMRCAGPAPRPLHSTQADNQPVSEPAVMADAPSPLRS